MDMELITEAHKINHTERWSVEATHHLRQMLRSKGVKSPGEVRRQVFKAWLSNTKAKASPGHKNPLREAARKDYRELIRLL